MPYRAEPSRLQEESVAIQPESIQSWSDLRNHAVETLTVSTPPDRRDERWRYTRAQDFLPPVPAMVETEAKTDAEGPSSLSPKDALFLGDDVLKDPEARRREGLRHGVRLKTIQEAWTEDFGQMEHLAARSPVRDHYFVRWNTAHLDEGYVVIVPQERPYEQPLKIVWRCVNPIAVRRLVLVLEPGARLNLVECENGRPNQLRHLVREIYLHPEAMLCHALLDSPGLRENWLWTTGVVVDTGAAYHVLGVHAGARKARHDLSVALRGLGGRTTLDAAALLPTGHAFDLQTEILHLADETESRQLVHTAAAARAAAVYGGTIVVESGTKGALAHQQSRGLLLDATSEVDSRPELHIRSDDVRCTHGASIGEIDPEALFYLQSRGLNVFQARALLLRAFALRVLEPVADAAAAPLYAPLAERLEELVRILVPEA